MRFPAWTKGLKAAWLPLQRYCGRAAARCVNKPAHLRPTLAAAKFGATAAAALALLLAPAWRGNFVDPVVDLTFNYMLGLITFAALAVPLFLARRLWLLNDRASVGSVWACQAAWAAALSGFWTCVFFPALMSPDSLTQWGEAMENRYSTWFPPAMAMLMHVAQAVSHSPALFAFCQGALFWFSLLFALWTVCPAPRSWLVGAGLLAVNPALWPYTSTLWKDVWTATFALFAAAFCALFLRTRLHRYLLAACAATALAESFRHNALLLAVVPPTLVLLGTSGCLLRRLGTAGLVALGLFFFPKLFELPANVRPAPFKGAAFIEQYVGLLVHLKAYQPAEYADEVVVFDRNFGRGMAEKAVAVYDPTMPANKLLWPGPGEAPMIGIRKMNKHFGFTMSRIMALALRHPWGYLRHRWLNVSALVQLDGVHYPFHWEITQNSLGLRDQPLLPGLRKAAFRCIRRIPAGVLHRHWLFILILVMTVPHLYRRRDFPTLAVAGVGLIYLLSLLVCDVWQDWRFLLTTYCCALIVAYVVALQWIGRRPKAPDEPAGTVSRAFCKNSPGGGAVDHLAQPAGCNSRRLPLGESICPPRSPSGSRSRGLRPCRV